MLETLLTKINALQTLTTTASLKVPLDLPQIVVIGSQSSGKSSVLENIVGRDFLPRGSGIVTRRPLILQLVHKEDAERDSCEFAHTKKTFYDFSEVKTEIEKETQRLLKNKNDVSDSPILLRLFSRSVASLTLIDLPGLVKIPTSDQPACICARIEKICRGYAENANAVILAVSPANSDIANSDALLLAREVDPLLSRTVGVLTKIDLMEGHACDILAGRVVSLRLGFVPLVCRSQAQILQNVAILDALKSETEFFARHEAYKKNRVFCGTTFLVEKLCAILLAHIKKSLPSLQESVLAQLASLRLESSERSLSPRELIFRSVNSVSNRFSECLSGKAELSPTELCGGARLAHAFRHSFAESIARERALEDVGDNQIQTLLCNSGGSSSTLSFAHLAFEKLCKSCVERLRPHCVRLTGTALAELLKILHSVVADLKFPVLREKIAQIASDLFRKNADAAEQLIEKFVSWNAKYINTRNPDFFIVSKDNTNDFNDSEAAEVEFVKSLVNRYFDVIKKIVIDQVPKAIMAELVLKSESELAEVLFNRIYEIPDVLETVKECGEAAERRKEIKQMIGVLEKANEIISLM